MSYGFDEESNQHEEIRVNNIPVTIKVEAENREGVASTSQRPQIIRVLLARLQDCEVVGEDEVTPNGDLVHFALLAGDEPINYNEALKNKHWKATMVEELQAIKRNNIRDLVELPIHTHTHIHTSYQSEMGVQDEAQS